MERNERYSIARKFGAVPGSMQTNEGAITIVLGKLRSRVKRQTHGGGMCRNQDIGHDSARDEVRPLTLVFGIVVTSDVGIRPPVESTVFY